MQCFGEQRVKPFARTGWQSKNAFLSRPSMANQPLLTLRPERIWESVNGNSRNVRLFENSALRGRA
jgi:hypothetical protein